MLKRKSNSGGVVVLHAPLVTLLSRPHQAFMLAEECLCWKRLLAVIAFYQRGAHTIQHVQLLLLVLHICT